MVFPKVTFGWLQTDSARPVIELVGTESEVPLDSDSIGGRLQSLGAHIGTADPVMRDCDQLGNLYQGDWPLRPLARQNTSNICEMIASRRLLVDCISNLRRRPVHLDGCFAAFR